MLNNLREKKSAVNLNNIPHKGMVVTALLCFYYLWLPHYLTKFLALDYGSRNNEYFFRENFHELNFIATISLSLMVFFILKRFSRIFDSRIIQRSQAHQFFVFGSMFFIIFSFFPLADALIFSEITTRSEAFSLIAPIRHNAIFSALFTIAFVIAIIEFLSGRNACLIFIIFFGFIPELFFGTRVTSFRLVIVALIIFPWNRSFILVILLSLGFIGFSRAIFLEYSSREIIDLVVLFVGDPLQINLGTSYLEPFAFECGIDFLHTFRPLIPPFFGFRDLLNASMGDVTICINDHGFGAGLAHGHGGSPINDMLIAPLSFLFSILGLSLVSFVILNARISAYVKTIFCLILISAIPYFMRNGYIATSNHVITVLLWVFLPLHLGFGSIKEIFNRSMRFYFRVKRLNAGL